MADIQINELMESLTASDSDWLAIDNGSSTKKISVENFNATGAASAAQSAAAAAQSASDAADSKAAAEQAEADTEALITSAQTIVSDASTYAGEALTSANTASTAANTATAQAAIATQAASTAAGYAQNVDSFAKTAKSWAVGGTGTRSGEDTDNSQYYSQQAHTSEINAAASETAAASSEAAAAISETNAAASESNAATSESNAATSETNAATSESNAASSASSAASSESNAATSESNAAASATAAGESEDDSEAWAWGKIDGVDVPATHPAYHNNAKYWADAASGGVSGVSSFNGRSGVVVPASGDYAANIIEFDTANTSLISTDVQSAIEEVQGNVEDVASDVAGLAAVATSGSYNDLTNKPTLGTAAAKDATSSITSGSTDLVESGAVYTGLSVKANSADLGTAAAKNFTTSVTTGSTDLVTSGAVKDAIDNVPSTWSGLTGKPFSSIGDGLTVFSDMLIADVSEVALDNIGIASASNTSSQQLCLNGNFAGTVVAGSMYLETSTKTTSSGEDTFTFTNAVITSSGVYDFYCDVYGVAPSDVVVSSGTMDVKFNSSDNVTTCRVYIK